MFIFGVIVGFFLACWAFSEIAQEKDLINYKWIDRENNQK